MALRADDVDLGRDRDLVERYQNGDPSAFDELYRRYFGRLHRFCQRHTRDVHEAEEIAQEAFVKALRSMDTLTGQRRFYPWITVIAKRLTIDRHRKLARVELTDQPDLGSVEPDLDHLFAAVDAGHVRDALAAVGPRHREVLLLREAQGLSYAEIGLELDLPITTVEALLHRARKALRREYATVAGDARGLWGLPVLGLVATRLGELRAKVSERWVEIGAIGAPVVAGAAAAPVDPGAPVVVAGVDPTGQEPPPGAPPTPPPPPAPAAAAGPVDVFVGPDGVDRAAGEAEEMPVRSDLGQAFAGLDPRPALGTVGDGLARTLEPLLGGTP